MTEHQKTLSNIKSSQDQHAMLLKEILTSVKNPGATSATGEVPRRDVAAVGGAPPPPPAGGPGAPADALPAAADTGDDIDEPQGEVSREAHQRFLLKFGISSTRRDGVSAFQRFQAEPYGNVLAADYSRQIMRAKSVSQWKAKFASLGKGGPEVDGLTDLSQCFQFIQNTWWGELEGR
eukprot:TRINITY_DN47161_c0_g1_i1.p1 TRINITY_DN47161_c0_g1~~TRINITY_DN47161_c0_g1_i1.p1  ORF type:complete len:195 (-),score=37.71 TRINITY_DN47161_c0_g1_i1:616-1149(-)